MERKIGEIFEYNGEWYQCVGGTCRNCSFYYDTVCKNITTIGSTNFGNCHCSLRTDHKSVIFKKLEKVGKPIKYNGSLYQGFKAKHTTIDVCRNCAFWESNCGRAVICDINVFFKRIKQTKEDMEENYKTEDTPLTRLVGKYVNNLIDYETFEKAVKELYSDKKDSKLTLKEFDLEAAKSGKPVCTRDGRKARILCYDFKQNEEYPILVAVENKDGKECALLYSNDGISEMYKSSNNELAMPPEKKEGWVNVYREETNNNERLIEQTIYKTRKDAFDNACPKGYITTTKLNWEE